MAAAPTIEELRRKRDEREDRVPFKSWQKVYTGRLLPDGSRTLAGAPTRKVWVRSAVEARDEFLVWGNVARPDLPVWIGPDANGENEIKRADNPLGTQSAGVALDALMLPPTPAGTFTGVITEANFHPGRVRLSELGGLYVWMEAFHYPGGWWPGGNILLVPPATANTKAWVRAYFDPRLRVWGQVTSPLVGLALPLTEADTPDVPLGMIGVGEVQLRNGQTVITAADFPTQARNLLGIREPLNNYTASVPPVASDDSSKGYSIGSRWINTTADTTYTCTDAAVGAAMWKQEDGAGGGGSVVAASPTALGTVKIDQTPASGDPVALTNRRLGSINGVAQLGGDRLVPSLEMPTLPNAGITETSRWVRHASNPVLVATVAWEQNAVYEPTVYYEDGLWKMWYSAGWDNPAIGYATSLDGVNWTKYAGNPVIGQGASGVTGIAVRNFVMRHGDRYYMYYADNNPNANLKVATSTDGIAWSVQGTALASNVVSWSTGWANTSVWVENGTEWKMLVDGVYGGIWFTALATSTNGIAWTLNPAGALTSLRVVAGGMYGSAYLPSPQKYNGLYHAWYHAATIAGNLPTNVYRATSTDLINWTQYAANPVLTYLGTGFEFDQVADVHVIEVLGKSHMYYDGDNNPAETASIGLVTWNGTLAELLGEAGQPVRLNSNGVVPPALLPTATANTLGLVRPDNTTLVVNGGVLSAVAIYGPISSGNAANPLILNSSGEIILSRRQ